MEEIRQHLAAGRHDRAFDLVVAAYRNRVFRLALSILRERTAAEDAAQETFVRIWKALPRFDGRAALGTWVYAVARNTCLMNLRRRRPTVSLDDPDSPDAQHAAASIATAPAKDPECALAVVPPLLEAARPLLDSQPRGMLSTATTVAVMAAAFAWSFGTGVLPGRASR